MPNPTPPQPGKCYHIYNRGNNRENLFIEPRNYRYFLHLYRRYIAPIAETYAYCLLPNHFHLLVRVRDLHTPSEPPPSRHFANFFTAYAKAVNRAYSRTGTLFQRPFGRIAVEDAACFRRLLVYIHQNPQRHALAGDFRTWPHSSYRLFLAQQATWLERDAALPWFGGRAGFTASHRTDVAYEQVAEWVGRDDP